MKTFQCGKGLEPVAVVVFWCVKEPDDSHTFNREQSGNLKPTDTVANTMNVGEILAEQAEDDVAFEFDDDDVEEAAAGKRKSRARDRTPEYKRKRRGGDAKKSKKTPDPSPSKPFQVSWCNEQAFKGWLKPVKDNIYAAKCIACNKVLQSGHSELLKHADGLKHKQKVKALQGIPTIDACLSQPSDANHKKAVKTAEIGMAAFFADHNVALMTVDHLVDMLKKRLPDSKIMKDVKMDRTKCTAIVNRVIGATETEETVSNLQNDNPFAILVDESTDIGMKKNFCILIKYYVEDGSRPKFRTDLLKLLELDAKDCSAESLYEAFKACLDEHGIPVKNCIGMASDNCNTMVGRNNSFWTRLRTDAPCAVLINCICHSAHLVASHACMKLPSNCKKLMQDVSSYVSGSPKRCAQLEEFREFHQAEYGKLRKLSFTRWLVLHACVERYLRIYHILVPFFEVTIFENSKDKEAVRILEDMQNPYTRAYLCFLRYVLDFLTKFNALFQSKKLLVHKLAKNSEGILRNICQNFVKPVLLSHIKKVDFANASNMVPLEQVFLGPEVNDILDKIPLRIDPNARPADAQAQAEQKRANDIKVFRLRCLDFYTTAAKELRDLAPLKDPFFEDLEFLEPENALSFEYRERQRDLLRVCNQFKNVAGLGLDPNLVALEWRTMPGIIEGRLKEDHSKMSVEEFWFEVGQLKDFEDTQQFPHLWKLARTVLTLPHSNADAETVFSMVTDVKCDKRNRMGNETLNGICIARSAFRSKKISCTDFQVKQSHLDKHNSETLYKK